MPGSLSEKSDKTTVSLSEPSTAVAAAALVHTLNRTPSDGKQYGSNFPEVWISFYFRA